MPFTPARLAQCAQQQNVPSCSALWPMILQPQWAQLGASAWIAHSKQSKLTDALGVVTVMVRERAGVHKSKAGLSPPALTSSINHRGA